jgi:hypothetical protein
MIEQTPRDYETIFLKCVLCPNGEVIFLGNTICWHNQSTKPHMFPHDVKKDHMIL